MSLDDPLPPKPPEKPKVTLKPDLEGGKSYLSQVAEKYLDAMPPKPPQANGTQPDFDERLPPVREGEFCAIIEMGPNADVTLDALSLESQLEAVRMMERARCRAIVLRHAGRSWEGNAMIEEIDRG